MNWRGRPLTSHEVVVQLIGATRTRSGLKVVNGHFKVPTYGQVKVPTQRVLSPP